MFGLIQENELIMLGLGVFVLGLILSKRSKLKEIPSSGILVFSYIVLVLGWVLTILEGFFLKEKINIVEHFCYLINAGGLTFWCYSFFYPIRKKK